MGLLWGDTGLCGPQYVWNPGYASGCTIFVNRTLFVIIQKSLIDRVWSALCYHSPMVPHPTFLRLFLKLGPIGFTFIRWTQTQFPMFAIWTLLSDNLSMLCLFCCIQVAKTICLCNFKGCSHLKTLAVFSYNLRGIYILIIHRILSLGDKSKWACMPEEERCLPDSCFHLTSNMRLTNKIKKFTLSLFHSAHIVPVNAPL